MGTMITNQYNGLLITPKSGEALAKAIMAHQEYPLEKVHGFTFKVAKEKKFIQKIIEAPITKLKKFSIKKERYDVIKEGALIFLEALFPTLSN